MISININAFTRRKRGDDVMFICSEVGAEDVTSAGVDPVDQTLIGKHVDAYWKLSVGRHCDTSYDWQIVATMVVSWKLVDLLVIRVREQ